jgi:hypothetical protein
VKGHTYGSVQPYDSRIVPNPCAPFHGPTFNHSSGVCYIRRPVPEELRPALGLEYKGTIQTRDPGEAKARFAAERGKSEEAFSLARAQLSGSHDLTACDIRQLASRWLRAELEQLERTGNFKPMLVQGSVVSSPEAEPKKFPGRKYFIKPTQLEILP